MSLSGIDRRRGQMAKTGFAYLFVTLFCVLFGAVYEFFSHEVYSYFMLYAFAFPLAGGVLPFFTLAFASAPVPGKAACNLYHSGIAALTVGSLVRGALEIYGTTNRLVFVYWAAGGAFLLLGIGVYLAVHLPELRAKRPAGPRHRDNAAG